MSCFFSPLQHPNTIFFNHISFYYLRSTDRHLASVSCKFYLLHSIVYIFHQIPRLRFLEICFCRRTSPHSTSSPLTKLYLVQIQIARACGCSAWVQCLGWHRVKAYSARHLILHVPYFLISYQNVRLFSGCTKTILPVDLAAAAVVHFFRTIVSRSLQAVCSLGSVVKWT